MHHVAHLLQKFQYFFDLRVLKKIAADPLGDLHVGKLFFGSFCSSVSEWETMLV